MQLKPQAKDPDLDNSNAHFKWILVVDRDVAPDFKAPLSAIRIIRRNAAIAVVQRWPPQVVTKYSHGLVCTYLFEALHTYMPVVTPKATGKDKNCAWTLASALPAAHARRCPGDDECQGMPRRCQSKPFLRKVVM